MKILIFGGTRFVGKTLVQLLINGGHDVTILTRGDAEDPFCDSVDRIRCDRSNEEMMWEHLCDKDFDVVYDNICFSANDASITCNIFENHSLLKYIFTSSMYVYDAQDQPLTEDDFCAERYIDWPEPRSDSWYRDGKRGAEAYFSKRARFNVSTVRFPIILGHDDYTGRFNHYISRILFEKPLYITSPQGRMNYVRSKDAARFLFWLKDDRHAGPVNAASSESFNASELIGHFSRALRKNAITCHVGQNHHSKGGPYCRKDNMVLDTDLANKIGFYFPSFHDWFMREVSIAKNNLMSVT